MEGNAGVLDNWEEIDEKELNSTVKKLEEETTKARQEEQFSGALLSSVQSTSMDKPVIILKRPEASREQNAQNVRPKTQVKPLHQRQQEYAEARMRILGSKEDGDFRLQPQPSTTSQTTRPTQQPPAPPLGPGRPPSGPPMGHPPPPYNPAMMNGNPAPFASSHLHHPYNVPPPPPPYHYPHQQPPPHYNYLFRR